MSTAISSLDGAYNSQANGFIEVAHRMFILGLRKLTAGFAKGWDKHLPALLWSERVTIRDGIGMSPFHYVVGFDAVLPVEVEVPTWRTLLVLGSVPKTVWNRGAGESLIQPASDGGSF